MIEILRNNIQNGKIERVSELTKGCWINLVSPTSDEIEAISTRLGVKEQLLRYPLDMAEKPHVDSDDDDVLIVVDAPVIEIENSKKLYSTIPLGLVVVRDEYLITISSYRLDVINEVMNSRKTFTISTDKKSRLIFQILYKLSGEYIKYISYISKDLEQFEDKMYKAMKNTELMPLLDFEKTMIYFNTSLKANQSVLQKISRGKYIKLYEEDEDILDDTMIENRQAIEMVQTYSEILTGIIDIFGTIVSNNLNQVMKFLTSITLIIAIPTLITSFMGMNVNFSFRTDTIGFYVIMIVTILVTALVAWWIKKKDMF